jgi:hypothetical protein
MGSIVSLLAHLMRGILQDGHATTQTSLMLYNLLGAFSFRLLGGTAQVELRLG